MIVVCSACPAQYSVPDAKIRGRKVRVTCKHCGTGFVVDATNEPEHHELRLDALEALAPASPALADEDATRMMPKRADFSVHDEPTVIGQIPAAALEAERRFSQRTVPPPDERVSLPAPVPAPAPPRALPNDVPEQPLDVTNVASPQAKRASQASLPPEAVQLAPLSAARASRPSLPPQPSAEIKTLMSRDLLEPAEAPRRSPWAYWLLALVVLSAVVLFTLTRR